MMAPPLRVGPLLAVSCAMVWLLSCSSAGDTGEGRLPTAAELTGYWAIEEDGRTLVWQFAPTATADSPELQGKADVFHIWDYATDADHQQAQRGTYTFANGALTYAVSWDRFYPCSPLADLCLTMVGKTYNHTILGFSGSTMTLSSAKTASGKRVLKRVSGCPPPKSTGRWVAGQTALFDHGYGEVGHARIAIDAKQRVHVLTGTANQRPLRHAVRQACGWSADVVDSNATSQSEFAFDQGGALHAAYWQKDVGKTAYAHGSNGVYQSVDFQSWYAPTLAVVPDGTPHVLVSPPDGLPRHGVRSESSWQWTELSALAGAQAVSPPVAHADGRVELLARMGYGWVLASHKPFEPWTVEPQTLPCDVVWRLQRTASGGLRALCGQTVVQPGGIVAKYWDTWYAERDGGPWKLTWLDDAMRGDLAVDSKGQAHVAFFRPGDGLGNKPGALVYGNQAAGDWLFEQVHVSGGLLREWDDLRLAVDASGKAHLHWGSSVYATNAVQASSAKANLRVTLDAGFSGNVTSLPKGMQCPGPCSLTVAAGTEVRLFVDFAAPHAMPACRPRAPGDAQHYECRVMVNQAETKQSLSAKPAPVAWAALYGGPGDETWHDVSHFAGGAIAAVGVAGAGAVIGKPLQSDMSGQLFVAGLGAAGQGRWIAALPVQQAKGETAAVAALGGGAAVGLTAATGWTPPGRPPIPHGAAVVALDGFGNITWARTLATGGGGTLTTLRPAADGGVWVSGIFSGDALWGKQFLTAAGPSDAYVAKLEATGETQWVIAAGTTGSDSRALLDTTAEGGAVVVLLGTGMPTVAGKPVAQEVPPSGALAFGVDAKGAVLWSTAIGDMALHGLRAMRAMPGGFVASTAAGLNFVHRLDTSGKILWTFQAQAKQQLVDMAVFPDGRLAFCASFSGGMSGAVVGQVMTLNSSAGTVATYLGDGDLPGCNLLRPIGDKDVLLAGVTAGAVQFGALVLPAVGGTDLWLARFVGK
ncbi:MAG: hypothetical protein FJ100_08415 [Deltaproteobacteria bacterium]|nr:hypothetical protein [Deltaproteobacteria bacterium]